MEKKTLVTSCNPDPKTVAFHEAFQITAQLFNISGIYKYHTRFYIIHSNQITRTQAVFIIIDLQS